MIYICNHCRKEMKDLKTPGDEVQENLICPVCSKKIKDLLMKAREVQIEWAQHVRRMY